MTRNEFLLRLDACLVSMGDQDRKAMVRFYAEQLDDRIDDGMTEEEAVASLEAPEEIAANLNQLNEEHLAAQAEATPAIIQKVNKTPGWAKALLIIALVLTSIIWIPVLAAIIVTLLSIYLLLWAIAATGFIIGLALMLLGVVSVVISVTLVIHGAPFNALAHLGIALIFMSSAIIMGLATYYYSYGIVLLTKALFTSWPRKKKKSVQTIDSQKSQAAASASAIQPVQASSAPQAPLAPDTAQAPVAPQALEASEPIGANHADDSSKPRHPGLEG